jgi:hypothetical protein
MPDQQLDFLTHDFFLHLDTIPRSHDPLWGKMNLQQMVEHVTAFYNVSTEKIQFELVTPEEHLPKFREFLFSDKQFRENTKAPASVIGEEPLPLACNDMEDAIAKLHEAVDGFVQFFKNNPGKKTLHPVFGPLNVEEWILLHYKHVTHHLRQFGIRC